MHLLYSIIFIILQCFITANSVQVDKTLKNTTSSDEESLIVFDVQRPLKCVEGDSISIPWASTVERVQNVSVLVADEFVSVISDHVELFHPANSKAEEYHYINASISESVTVEGLIQMTAKFIGVNDINVILYGENNTVLAQGTISVGVTLKDKRLPDIFELSLVVILIIVYIDMGANIDLKGVKKIFNPPIGPAIGLICQYVCMPMISFALGTFLFPNKPLFRLGLFASGCAPGGGVSNMWTHLLGGSLDLSIMMTFVSTAFSLGTIPLWLLTLGKVIQDDADFVIPYMNVFYTILIMVVPSIIGIIIQLKFERITKIMRILITPLSVINILFICTFGVYANLYLFSYMTWKAILGGFTQTLSGLFMGYFIAFLCGRNQKERIAIGIETSVQNNNIAFLILKNSLGSPDGELAVLMPGCVGLFTPIPFFILLFIKIGYEKISAHFSKKTKGNKIDIVGNGVKEDKEKIENKDTYKKYQEEKEEKGIDNPGLESTNL